MDNYHTAALLKEVIERSGIVKSSRFVDCTLGGGGHFLALLEKLEGSGLAVGVDKDIDAIEHVSKRLDSLGYEQESDNGYKRHFLKGDVRVILVNDDFRNINKFLGGIDQGKYDLILADLGVSSHQLDDAKRGFSFKGNGELDMRMSQKDGLKAVELVNGLYQSELEKIFRIYGEEGFAKKIAKKIVICRQQSKITTTSELFHIIQKAVPYRNYSQIRGTAQRVFQALRIQINDELAALQDLLVQALDQLDENGKLMIISFHSLEDRIVKQYIKLQRDSKNLILVDDLVMPSEEEIKSNSRVRSAKLRIISLPQHEKKSLAKKKKGRVRHTQEKAKS